MLRDEKFYFGIFRGKTVLIRVCWYIYIYIWMIVLQFNLFYSMNFDKILRGEIERVFEALKIYWYW